MKAERKSLVTFLFMVSLFAAAPFVGLYLYDPLQLFNQHKFDSHSRLHGNMRLQAAGIINNYSFDSIILGTSMMKGTSAKMASNLLGGEFVNISADGSTINERSLVLSHALENKNLRSVIFSFDTGLDIHTKKDTRKYPIQNYDFLYSLIF